MKLVHLVGFITKKFVTMHGHMNIKNAVLIFVNLYNQKFKCEKSRSFFFSTETPGDVVAVRIVGRCLCYKHAPCSRDSRHDL